MTGFLVDHHLKLFSIILIPGMINLSAKESHKDFKRNFAAAARISHGFVPLHPRAGLAFMNVFVD